MTYRPKHVVEYVAAAALQRLVMVLPTRAALAVGWGVAFLGHYVVRWRAAEARRRIREVLGPGVPARRIRRIAWLSMRNLCFNAIEMMRMEQIDEAWVDAHIDASKAAPLFDHAKAGQGYVLAVAHLGHWDLGGVGGCIKGLPMVLVVRQQKNPLINEMITRARRRAGATVVPNNASMLKSVIRLLRQGHVMTLLPDVRSRTEVEPLEFLGQQANISPGTGMFARQAGVPVLVAYVLRIGWTRHAWHVAGKLEADPTAEKRADWQRITQDALRLLEAAIRAHPEQYFWYNKRWVLEPFERGPEA